MKPLEESIFDEVGLESLTTEEKQRILSYVSQTLKIRLGLRLLETATQPQLEEFADLRDKGDDEAAFSWLESSFPNYPDILEEELAGIKANLAEVADEVLRTEP